MVLLDVVGEVVEDLDPGAGPLDLKKKAQSGDVNRTQHRIARTSQQSHKHAHYLYETHVTRRVWGGHAACDMLEDMVKIKPSPSSNQEYLRNVRLLEFLDHAVGVELRRANLKT